MLSRMLAAAVMVTPLLISCDRDPVSPPTGPAAFAPAGTGSKQVFTVDDSFTFGCPGGAVLNGRLGGFFQVMSGNGGNLELNVYHLVFTFSNPATGQSFAFHDVGPDRVYVKDGNLYIAITGRSSATGVIGHVVINLTTGDAELVAGNEFGDLAELACQKLT
jgi:hypothetical protein